MQSNPIRREWVQHRRGAGNSNFVQLVPAVTSPHLNEPLDNPQKYDPSVRGSLFTFLIPSWASFNRPLTSVSRGTTLTQMSQLGHAKWNSCAIITYNNLYLLCYSQLWMSKTLILRSKYDSWFSFVLFLLAISLVCIFRTESRDV